MKEEFLKFLKEGPYGPLFVWEPNSYSGYMATIGFISLHTNKTSTQIFDEINCRDIKEAETKLTDYIKSKKYEHESDAHT